MTDEERRRFIDKLLDTALARRRAQFPPDLPPDFEDRLVSRLRAEPVRPSHHAAPWRWAVAACACLAVLLAVPWMRRPAGHTQLAMRPTPPRSGAILPSCRAKSLALSGRSSSPFISIRSPSVLDGKAEPFPPAKRRSLGRRSSSRWQRAEPRQPVFPSPLPLTKEERLLLSYVQRAPAFALAKKEDDSFRPLEIEPLKIAPLELDSSPAPETGKR